MPPRLSSTPDSKSAGNAKRFRGGHFPNSHLPYHSTHSQNALLPASAAFPPASYKPPEPGICPVPYCQKANIPRCELHPVSWDEDMQRVLSLSVSEYANNEVQCEVSKHVIRDHPCVAKTGNGQDKATNRDRESGRPQWSCPIPYMADGTPCGYLSSRKSNLVSHLTSKHCPATKHYFCCQCAAEVGNTYARGLDERLAYGEGTDLGERSMKKILEDSRFRTRGEFKTAENAKKHFLEKDSERMEGESTVTKRRKAMSVRRDII